VTVRDVEFTQFFLEQQCPTLLLKASILSSIHLLVTCLNVPGTKLYCEANPKSLNSGGYPHILIVIMCTLAFYWAIVTEEKASAVQ